MAKIKKLQTTDVSTLASTTVYPQTIADAVALPGRTLTTAVNTIESNISSTQQDLSDFKATKGVAGGLAALDSGGRLPSEYLDDYVYVSGVAELDSIVENFTNITIVSGTIATYPVVFIKQNGTLCFKVTNTSTGAVQYSPVWSSDTDVATYGERTSSGLVVPVAGKIYIDKTENKCYRWDGSALVPLVMVGNGLALGSGAADAYPGTSGAALEARVDRVEETMGPYSERESIVLTASATGYVIDSNGAKVAKAGWAMAEFTAEKGNVYLFKPGATDGNVSVFAEAITSIETRAVDYTYTYNEDGTIATAVATYNGKTHSYTYTYDESGNCTIKEGTTVINELPMTYTTTVGSYSPLVRLNANAELPKDGYCRYMSHFKGNSAIKVVVSYKVGSADLTMKVTRDGVLASISTQLGNLSQKEDETRSQLAEKAPTIWARILATKDCAIKIDGKIVELPAHKNVIVRDFTQVNAYASPDYYAPRNITKFEIHTNGIAKLKAFSLLAGYSQTKDGDGAQWRAMDGIESLDLSCIDTSEITVFQGMFRQLFHTNLKTLDVSGIDLSNAKNAYMMFSGCSSVTALDVSGFRVDKVQDHSIVQLFGSCSSLTTLDVSNWDTSNVTNIQSLFSGCSSLTTLDVSNWDTSNVTNIQSLFSGCSSLTTLDVSNWDTSNVTNIQFVFAACNKLTNLIFGPKWGKQTSTETNALTLDLSQIARTANYKLTDATWESMLTMYDRKSAGLADMTIKLSTKHNVPDGWTDKMVARGYVITLV